MAAKHWYVFVRDLHTGGYIKLRTDKVWVLKQAADGGEISRHHFDVEIFKSEKDSLQFGMVVKNNINKIVILEIDGKF